jgi:xylulokinase
MTADILRLKVEKMQAGEGPAFGAAILAMVGAGAFANVEEACDKLINITESYSPCEVTAALYDQRYPVYKNLYGALKESFHTIAAM